MIAQTQIESFDKIFNGAVTRYGKLTYHDPQTGAKDCTEVKSQSIPMEVHLEGKNYLGRSPVNEKTLMCDWIGIDIDLYLNPKDICKNIFEKIGTKYFCFMTLNKKWRVVEFLDEALHVEEAHKRAKALQDHVRDTLGIEIDEKSTVPTNPSEEGAVGRWFFLPYGKQHDTCYSPNGTPLNLKQFIFRHKYRNHPIVVAGVGIGGGGVNGSRGNHLYYVNLYKKHFDCDVELEEVNDNYGVSLDDRKFNQELRHVEKTILKDTYNKEYYLNGEPGWIEKTCGVRPCLDAKSFVAITDAILDNHIYAQSRTDFFELDTKEFKSKEQINDWWKSTKPKNDNGRVSPMSAVLLEQEGLIKVRSYLTHAGLNPGVVKITKGLVKGLKSGDYLNIYEDPQIEPNKDTPWKRVDDYYNWALGPDNWMIEKQRLAFQLNAREEMNFMGIKIQWFSIWHSKVQGVGKGLFAQLCQSMFGYPNVAPNVKFKEMISTHTTIIEGKQIIFLNEVVLENNTAKTKTLSNEFKDLITEPNLFINPKNKPQIQIPNLCNFYVHSNSDTPLYIEDEDRRAFVVNIKHTKQSVNFMLNEEGFKKDILEVIKDPSGFKWHLLNEITYDRQMFFDDAPYTQDKEELINSNKGDFIQEMEARFENEEFPFGDHQEYKGYGLNKELHIDYYYNGMISSLDLKKLLKKSEEFKDVYFQLNDIVNFLKSHNTKWENGDETRQAVLPNGRKKRVYNMHPVCVDGSYLVDKTEGELGELYTRKTKVPF